MDALTIASLKKNIMQIERDIRMCELLRDSYKLEAEIQIIRAELDARLNDAKQKLEEEIKDK